MTNILKFGLLVYTALTIVLAASAGMFFFTQRPAVEPPAGLVKNTQTPNRDQIQQALNEAEDKKLRDRLREAQDSWLSQVVEMNRVTPPYYAHQDFYAKQLADVEVTDADLKTVDLVNGKPKLNPTGLPLLTDLLVEGDDGVRNKPVKSAKFYRESIVALTTQVTDASKAYIKLVDESTSLTNKLIGTLDHPEPDKQAKGLYLRVDEEKHKHKQIRTVYDELNDLLNKTNVDYDLHLRRKKQMEEREKELKAKLSEP